MADKASKPFSIDRLLASAIKQALFESAPARPSDNDLAELAKDAHDSIRPLKRAVAEIPTSTTEDRRDIARTLFLASINYAQAIAFLLAEAPRDLAVAACGLYRSALESCYRGAFIGYTASEEQASDYLENGSPRVRTSNGKWRDLSFKELAGSIDQIHQSSSLTPSRVTMTELIDRDGRFYHGLVHVGQEVTNLYANGGLPPEGFLDVLRWVVSSAMISATLAGSLGEPSEKEFRSLFAPALDQALGFFDRHEDFQRKHGLSWPDDKLG